MTCQKDIMFLKLNLLYFDMINELLLKTYIFILLVLSKDKNNLSENFISLNDFLQLFSQTKLSPKSTRDFLHLVEDCFNLHIEIGKKIQLDYLNIDETILLNCLSTFHKLIGKNIFSIHYEETQEVGFLIPNLTFFSLNHLEQLSDFILINDFLPLNTSLINTQWTKSTNGGKIIIKQNQIIFKLAGFKLPDTENNLLSKLIPTFSSPLENECEKLIQNYISEWNSNKITDTHAFFNAMWENLKPFLNKPNKIEIRIDKPIPILKIPELTFSSILLCNISPFIISTNFHTGIFSISYEVKRKNFVVETMIRTDKPFEYPLTAHNTIKYFMEQIKGRISIESKEIKNDYLFTIALHIPDDIGTFLDNELPGWECLTIESQDILRRLCYDYSIPYEHPFISELLRFEIENYFHKLFSMPLFTNLSHELLEKNKGHLSPTIKSVLEEIEKGKIKRNSLNPVFIGQIMETFLILPNVEDRICKIFNTNLVDKTYLMELSKVLKEFPLSAKSLISTLVFLIQNTRKPI